MSELLVFDVLVVGAGPAALAIAAELAEQGLAVVVLAASDCRDPWPNTYGIWGDEVDALGLGHLLEHRWSDTLSYFGAGSSDPADPANSPTAHGRDYGLFDKNRLQQFWLERCEAAGVQWLRGQALELSHGGGRSQVATAAGEVLEARLVLDASGHKAVFVRRPDQGPVAGQAAYGVVGRFTAPPVEPGQFVLMDYRADHLSPEERSEPPTFLYAMDLGQGRFFVEETSLALAPPVPYATLKQRLERRLAHRGVAIEQVEHEEFCLFPMNLPLPDLDQPVLAFGGAAAMVHPASGYLVGALLRRAPAVAAAVAARLRAEPAATSAELAAAGWQALWPPELRRKQALYQFGLEKLMRFSEPQLRSHFASFFSLPSAQWYGFLTNTLSLGELLAAMLALFATAPWSVRWGLMGMRGRELQLGLRMLDP
ncbi:MULTISPECIES: lycopene beta cyclase [unclassified Cyanobium]|uniref:lycopene beta cyclase n=1 Tax=unclassified Cyanobium TaxID=2627006 RepID=UPI0020CCCD53|nr:MULTISPECIES: lycopene cyclase family protein [unclassified Cyanobium]MCP9777198.1 lycopene cyclase family protein [Cyanobium sp. Tous-M-B4]MCP9877961.1 lycopene cyclase family protein [Cyanobium sp. A2C-AMD]